MGPLTVQLAEAGVAVLAETPPAADLAGLRDLWARVGDRDLVQVAEQYPRMPQHAARLAVVRDGVIGDVTSVQVSSTHLYHAIAMIRAFLGVGRGPVTVRAQSFTAPLANPLSPSGWSGSAEPEALATTLATLDFGEARMGLYDFTDNQWWNPLRARRIVIRGSLGEIVDERVTRLVDPYTPVESQLIRRQAGLDLNLEGVDLQHISFDGRVVYRNAFAGARFSEDDLAVADLLAAMGAWRRGDGPQPYPLAEACTDHQIALAIGEACASGRSVTTSRTEGLMARRDAGRDVQGGDLPTAGAGWPSTGRGCCRYRSRSSRGSRSCASWASCNGCRPGWPTGCPRRTSAIRSRPTSPPWWFRT